jgi:outer membrane protein
MLGALFMAAGLMGQVAAPPARILTLAVAERQALAHQPQIAQAEAQTAAAYARSDESRASLYPQVNATASYSRQTANFVPRPGALPTGGTTRAAHLSGQTFDSFNFGISANQLVYDFGQTYGSFRAARANAEAQHQSEESVRQGVLYNVRSAYLLAWANHALLGVAKDALMNQDRHLSQVDGQVKVGTRPEIDLAQVKADRASAQLSFINAENAYETAKAQLNQAMGVEGPTDFDVNDERVGEVAEEQMDGERLAAVGAAQRPELKSLMKQAEADERQLGAVKGAYGPSLGVSTGLSEGGADLTAMAWNWQAQATLTWPLFQGGITNARVREATANQSATRSQTALERQQIRFDVTQARLAVRAAKAGLATAREIEANARERLRLAEARYQAGVGSIIELQDAQVAATTASGQVVQADYNLSVSRAQLLKAVGRR